MSSAQGYFVLLGQLKLSQKRYARGVIRVQARVSEGTVEYIDCRFYLDDTEDHPTRQGFRVYGRDLDELCKVVYSDELPSSVVLSQSGSTQLVVRRLDDDYGGAVDFRYRRTTGSFVGWEKRGIRFREADFGALVTLLRDARLAELAERSVPKAAAHRHTHPDLEKYLRKL